MLKAKDMCLSIVLVLVASVIAAKLRLSSTATALLGPL